MIDSISSMDGSNHGCDSFPILLWAWPVAGGWRLVAGGVEDEIANRWKTWAGAFRFGSTPASAMTMRLASFGILHSLRTTRGGSDADQESQQ